METVWKVFAPIAVVLGVAGWLTLGNKGVSASSFAIVGRCLFGMALGTAVFPLLLPLLGARWWIGAYIAFVVALTVAMVTMAVARTRRRS